MELRHLRYFVAVAEHMHFGRAADALATAQPSLSRQILQLEDELGVKLFDRTNKHVALTGAGRTFLIDAQRTLAAADAGVRHARETADGTRGELRLAFLGGAMMMLLPAVLREHRRRFPDVKIEPHAMHYPEHLPALHAGAIDIAWTVAAADPEIASQVVAQDRLLVVIPTDHAFVERSTIEIGDFTTETLIVLSRAVSPRLYDETMELCLTRGFRPPHVIEVLEEETVLGLVAAGFGVAVVPYPWSVIHIPGIAFRTYPDASFIQEVLSWRRDRETPIIRAFVDTTLELLEREDAPPRDIVRPV